MDEFSTMGCAGLVGVAAELALGALTGRERAQALSHLDRCEACQENVHRLTITSERLLELLPASEAPPGFEAAVLERLGIPAADRGVTAPVGFLGRRRCDRQRRRPGHHRRILAVAVAVVAGAGAGGWGLRSVVPPAPAVSLRSAALVSPGHQSVGEIFAYAGSPGWLYMSVDSGSWSGTVVCELAGRDGRVTTAGWFRLTGGYGSWGTPDSADNAALTSARLVTPDGAVLATASFAGA